MRSERSTSFSTDCESSEACRAKYPDLAARTRALLARLEKNPPRASLDASTDWIAEEVSVTAAFVANVLGGGALFPRDFGAASRIAGSRAKPTTFKGCSPWASSTRTPAENMSAGCSSP